MKLRINSKDHNLVEDDFGNPIFRFLGLHPSDKDEIINAVNDAEDIEYLKNELAEAEDKLDRIGDLL